MQGIRGLAGSGLAEAIHKIWIKQTNAGAVLHAARDEARVLDLDIMVKELKPLSCLQSAAPCVCSMCPLLKEGTCSRNCTDESMTQVPN